MRLQVRLIAIFVALEAVCLDDIFQYALDVGVEHLHRQLAALGSSQNGLVLLGLSGLKHVVASQHRGYGIVPGIPVADVHTLPTPFIANDGGQQFMVLHGIRTVQFVIRCHDGPRVTLFNHNLEGLQVYLAQGTL